MLCTGGAHFGTSRFVVVISGQGVSIQLYFCTTRFDAHVGKGISVHTR